MGISSTPKRLWKPLLSGAPTFYTLLSTMNPGLINIDNTGLGRQMIKNYKKLGEDVKPELVGVE